MLSLVSNEKPEVRVSDRRLVNIDSDYLEGMEMVGKDRPANPRKAIHQSFASWLHAMLMAHDADDLGDLPVEMQARINALHAMIFCDDEEAREALLLVPQDEHAILYDVRREMLRMEKLLRDKAQHQALPRADLAAELGGLGSEGFHERLLQWLEANGEDPATWHMIVLSMPPEGMDAVYYWIARQPACDCATTAVIFHLVQSHEMLELKDIDAAERVGQGLRFQIAKTIARRWENEEFVSYRYAFPQFGWEREFEDYKDISIEMRRSNITPPFKVMPGLFVFRPGEEPQTQWFIPVER